MTQSSSAGMSTTGNGSGASAPAKQASQQSSAGSIKETIDSILIAFIFAFIFRAFVVEAFVIPTGSMAPTLLGAHMRFVCEHCGYGFTVNYSPMEQGAEMRIPDTALRPTRVRDDNGREGIRYLPYNHVVHCANCGQRLANTNTPKVHYGDRILVLKYLYLFQDPQRYDVVVFKSPYLPATYQYAQNYIKRLIGKPGESIMILDGDIYVGTSSQPLEAFEVQTKPPVVQDSLWRIVYDNDYQPNERTISPDDDWRQPWSPVGTSTGWDVTAQRGRVFRFDDIDGTGTLVFDRRVNPAKHALTDWLAYDVDSMNLGTGRTNYESATDLKLAFHYGRHAGQGPLKLELTKFGVSFIAEIGDDRARLLKDGHEIGSLELSGSLAGRTVPVEFTNVDYRVTLRVDGQELATTPEQYRPDVATLLKQYRDRASVPPAEVRITATQQQSELSHISLWRDVYYLNRDPRYSQLLWGAPERQPGLTREGVIDLGPDEYFVLGDNSPISGDSRYWEDPIELPHEDLFVRAGRVPGRFLLGKAFFVYWPAGYQPVGEMPAIVPNFGDMRFIH